MEQEDKPVIAAITEFTHDLLKDALRDCLIMFGVVGNFIRQDTLIAIVLVVVLVLVFQVCKARRKKQ